MEVWILKFARSSSSVGLERSSGVYSAQKRFIEYLNLPLVFST